MDRGKALPSDSPCNPLFAWCASLCFIWLPCATHADIVTDWNEKAAAIMEAEKVTRGPNVTRTFAIMHIAMFEAVNATSNRYRPYLASQINALGASSEAAAHAAARRTLTELFPKQKAVVDTAYDMGMAAVPESSAKSAGIVAGEKAGAFILDERKADGISSQSAYRPATSPGVYVPTALPVFTNFANVKPFTLTSAAQFRPGPPAKLGSAVWARDYNETRRLGGAQSTIRTAWQSETARFWQALAQLAWNEAARGLVVSKPLPLDKSARLFAHLNVAMFDTGLAIFDTKYTHGFWRPITAIRNGDRDSNDATERDPEWAPLIDTPMHPEYPCAHCGSSAAGATVLKSVFGAGALPEFTVTSAAMPGVMHKYTSIQELDAEIGIARIWGGVHFRNSNEVGSALGAKVAEHVLQSYLQPVH